MNRLKLLLALVALLVSTLACATLFGDESYSDEDYYTEEDPGFVTDEAPAQDYEPSTGSVSGADSCPVLTDKILQIATTPSDSEAETMDEEVTLVSYLVNGDEISDPVYESVSSDLQSEQDDETTQYDIWNYYTTLIPPQSRSVLTQYVISTDGVDGTLASVAQTESDPNSWALFVDIADVADRYNLTYTLLHEFGHLLTLGPNQVPPSIAVFNNPDDDNIYLQESSNCPNYFPGEGCANANSYIDGFYYQFWDDIHDEWNDINLEEDEDIYYQKLDDFYYKYQDRFLTDYAATNPEEDIAESWTFFVLSPKPAGNSIAEEKILFFYQYPELVQLRSEILSNLCVNFPQ